MSTREPSSLKTPKEVTSNKSPRKSLVKLSKRDAKNLSSCQIGELVDESFNRRKVALVVGEYVLETKLPAFLNAFGVQLGFYRSLEGERGRRLSPRRELEYAMNLNTNAQEVARQLELLPVNLKTALDAVSQRHRGELFHPFQTRLLVALATMSDLLSEVERSFEPHVGKRGRLGEPHRDGFLYGVAQLLKEAGVRKAGDRATAAAGALMAVGVPCPEDPRDCEKLIAAYARLRS